MLRRRRVRRWCRSGRLARSGWSYESASVLETAQNRGVSVESLRMQFGRLGNTPYELREVTLDISGSPFAPVSVLNQMRREAVEQLQALQSTVRAGIVNDC